MTAYDDFRRRFNEDWGFFRRFISQRPLTGFWIGAAVGGLLVYAVTAIL